MSTAVAAMDFSDLSPTDRIDVLAALDSDSYQRHRIHASVDLDLTPAELDEEVAVRRQEKESSKVRPLPSEVSAADFFGEAGFIPAAMGELLKREFRCLLGTDGALYRYVDGVYRADGEQRARDRVRRILGERYKRRHIEETVSWLRAHVATDFSAPPSNVLNVRNGLLDWRSGELTEHSPDLHTAVQLPIQWKPDAQCPGIDAFLADVLPDAECVDLVFEIAGYALIPENTMHKAVLLLGPGRNGKSVLLSVLRALIGAANVAAVPLQLLSESRFAAGCLYGKLANVCGDLDARAVKNTDMFKMLTGGDLLYADKKYSQPFSFINYALPIFSANEPPLSSDQSEAWFARWVVIPMDKRIPAERRDPHLTEKLTTPAELEGFMVRAVEGLRRLMERGRFPTPKAVEDAGDEYRERLDTVRGFLKDDCELGGESFTARKFLYIAYQSWCRDEGRYALAAPSFYGHLRANHSEECAEKTIHGVRGFGGIVLRSAPTEPCEGASQNEP